MGQSAMNNSVLLNLKSVKLTEDEQNFIVEYRRLEELEREKGIKFFQCVGDPPHTQEFVDDIAETRKSLIDYRDAEMRDRDCTRFGTVVDSDKVVVDTSAGTDIAAKPRWDAFENNHFAMRRRLVAIFLKVTNKLISRMRAGKRLEKIRRWIEGNNIRSREDMRKKVAEDYKRAINMRVGEGDDEDDIRNVKFTFSFNAANISLGMQKLPLEYETNISSFLEKVEANPPTNFDDLEPYDPVEELDFETQNYAPFSIPAQS